MVLPNSHPFLDISWCKIFVKVYYKLGKLFNIDNVLRIITLWVDDFGTASNLGENYILSSPLLTTRE